MRRLNKSRPVGQLVMSLALDNDNDPMIGCIVRFKNWEPNMGWLRKVATYVIGGRQRMWGYNEQGQYTMIEGYRAFRISHPEYREDTFGVPIAPYDIELVEPTTAN